MNSVSIIIPTWNRAATLERAVRSCLEQSVLPLEVLVCDDGSSDQSHQIVAQINDSRVIWVDGERGGRPAIPRNRGLKLAKGEWVAFLDSDDAWLPQKLEKQLATLQKSGNLACSSNATVVREGKTQEEMLNFQGDIATFADLLKNNTVITSSTIVQRELLLKCGGFPEEEGLKALEDYALWLRVACFTNFSYLSEPLILYTDDAKTSVRSSVESNYLKQQLAVLNNFLTWAKTAMLNKNCPAIRLAKWQYRKHCLIKLMRRS